MSDKFLIHPCGALRGDVHISGAKNAVLPVLAAGLLTGQKCTVQNVPHLSDVEAMCGLLDSVGVGVDYDSKSGDLNLCAEGFNRHEAAYEWVGRLRASFLVIGPMLARLGRAKVPLPGGCAIGTRPVDLHLKGLAALGAEIEHSHGYITARARRLRGANRLRGAKIYLDFPSVGATENLMMASCLAEGQTILENCAVEPEIVDLANFLNAAGADIRGAGTDTVKINGTKELHGVTHPVIPDRIEAGTFMVAAALTRGDIRLTNVMADHLKPVTAKLKEVNVKVEDTEDGLHVYYDPMTELVATDIKTMPYPGFPTDMQALFMALMSTVNGTSIITETVFENRFMQAGELNRMGAEIKIESRSAVIEGVKKLAGAQVVASDLRAGAALMLAALAADGKTELSGAEHIDRGYCALDKQLNRLGARVERIL